MNNRSNTRHSTFTLSPDLIRIQESSRKFFMAEMHNLQGRMDDEEWWPPDVFSKLGEAGYLGLTVAAQYGGAELDVLSAGIVLEQCAYANHQVALSYGAHDNLCINNIYRNGTETQRRRYLPHLCSGRWVGALGLTESGAGSDAVGSMKTTAHKENDRYLLNGSKLYITNGPIADVVLVYARTNPGGGRHGISAFIVEKGFSGFRAEKKLDKMGYRGSPTGELVFQNCEVPADNLLGSEHDGLSVMMGGLDLERALIAAICCGIAERAFFLALQYAKTRQQFGQTIASFQLIQSKLARMYVALESGRTLTYRVLAACHGVEVGGGGRGEIHKLAAAAYFHATEACKLIVDEAVQIFGGMGCMRDVEINRLYRASKTHEIGGGTMEMRELIIAQELLRD
jgi:isovaleryl-CoA dehydrogenase